MALFSKFVNPQHRNPNHAYRQPQAPVYRPAPRPAPAPVTVMSEAEALRRLRGVRQLCQCRQAHSLPVELIHLAETRTDRGTPMLVLACSVPGCNWREGWAIDFRTGQPFRLWGRVHAR